MTDEAAILLRAAAEVRAEFGRRTVGSLTVHQAVLLSIVCAQPGSSQRAISRESGIDSSTLGTMLHYLKAQAYITIERSKDDTRATIVRPTVKGIAIATAGAKTLRATSISVMNRVHPANRVKFASGLREIVEAK